MWTTPREAWRSPFEGVTAPWRTSAPPYDPSADPELDRYRVRVTADMLRMPTG